MGAWERIKARKKAIREKPKEGLHRGLKKGRRKRGRGNLTAREYDV